MLWKATIPLVSQDLGAVSVNRLYITRKQDGRKALSKVGRAFQKEVVAGLLHAWGLRETPDPNAEYRLVLEFYLPAVFSKGWPKTAKFRFRRIDQSNLIKFFQDCIVAASGVDDANHTMLLVTKREDAENPRLEVQLEVWEWL